MSAAEIKRRIESVLAHSTEWDDPTAHALGITWSQQTGGSAEALAARFNAPIEERLGGLSTIRYAISEFFTRGRTIVLYRDTLETLARLVERFEIEAWFDPARLREIALAHEVYHLLEDARVLPRRKYRSAADRERAANAFAQGFCGLPRSPAVLGELLPLHLAREQLGGVQP